MNIDLGNSGNYEDLPPIFACNGSPYLSPFLGSLSPELHGSYERIDDFKLQELEQEYIDGEAPNIEFHFADDLLSEYKGEVPEEILRYDEPKHNKAEMQTPTYIPKPNTSNVYSIIQFLVINYNLPEADLKVMSKNLCDGQQNLHYIFEVLLIKFKKLRKTKEEMVKFCMRKAFKFVEDIKKSQKKQTSKHRSNQKGVISDLPFRKNSSQKTMNSQFLKQTFSNKQFQSGYHFFLQKISEIIQEDNSSKIQYLASMIQKMINKNEIKDIERIKRLPWNQSILTKTENLARGLLVEYGHYADQLLGTQQNLNVTNKQVNQSKSEGQENSGDNSGMS